MSPLLFLGAAVVISVVGTLILWLRHRDTSGPDASIDEFRSKMRALSEEQDRSPGPDGVGRQGG
ncbi:MAG: hypothetical protein R2716_11845 [Microthrixaceae bacterium]